MSMTSTGVEQQSEESLNGATDELGRLRARLAELERERDHLVAAYEDPSLKNLVVDLNRYPELQRALESGETVFIPDASTDPMLEGVHETLAVRKVRSIVVAPIRWRNTVIGAIFLRTERDAAPFADRDVRFCQVVASLTAGALRNAHRFETLL